LFAIWRALPPDPLTESQLEAAVLKVLDGPGREADASAHVSSLVHSAAVVPTRDEAGVVRFAKAETFPEWPEEVGPGTEAYDRQTAELSDQLERQLDDADEEKFRNSPQNRQRQELEQVVRLVIGNELPAMLREAVRAELPALLRVELPTQLRRSIDEAALRSRVQALIDKNAPAKADGDNERPA
jgi:hypothetical protein